MAWSVIIFFGLLWLVIRFLASPLPQSVVNINILALPLTIFLSISHAELRICDVSLIIEGAAFGFGGARCSFHTGAKLYEYIVLRLDKSIERENCGSRYFVHL